MKCLIHRRWNLAAYIAVSAVLLFVVCLPAFGQVAGAGYDAFQTGSGASVDLTSMGLGPVNLQGVAIPSSSSTGSLGNTDTIMYRPQAIPAAGGTVPVNLYALFMKSTSPVTYNNVQADVYITVNNTGGVIPTTTLPQPDTLTPSTGTITVYPSTSTFDSSITVNADVIIVTTGSNPANTSAVLTNQPANTVTLAQTGSSYSTTAPTGYPFSPTTTLTSGGIYFHPVHTAPTHPHPVVTATLPKPCTIIEGQSGFEADAKAKGTGTTADAKTKTGSSTTTATPDITCIVVP
jgi:hypothetical protein